MLASASESQDLFPIRLASPSPLKARFYECLIKGRAEHGIFLRILAIFESRGIKVSKCSFESDSQSGIFGTTMVLELKNSSQDMVGLVEKVMETKVVTSIEFSRLEGKMFSNFHFPIFLFPNKRGIILLAEELNILENDLKCKLGSEASSVIFEWGRRYGSNLVSQFPESDVRKEEALEYAVEIIRATGWGIGKCETDEKRIVKFSLSDPPIDSKLRTSRFPAGMVQGIVEKITRQNMQIIEDHFDAQKNSLNFTLIKSDTNTVS